jgi:hypothetical protein
VLVTNDFEDATSQDWTLTNTASIYSYVSGENYAPQGTKALAIPAANGIGNGIADLTLSVSGYTNYAIAFSWKWKGTNSATRQLHLDYSLDGGSAWSNSLFFISSAGASTGSVTNALAVLETDTVKFRFRGWSNSGGGGYTAHIDGITITGLPDIPPAGTVITLY